MTALAVARTNAGNDSEVSGMGENKEACGEGRRVIGIHADRLRNGSV